MYKANLKFTNTIYDNFFFFNFDILFESYINILSSLFFLNDRYNIYFLICEVLSLLSIQ